MYWRPRSLIFPSVLIILTYWEGVNQQQHSVSSEINYLVDALQISHRTEPGIPLDPPGFVHERLCSIHKVDHILLRALFVRHDEVLWHPRLDVMLMKVQAMY